MISTKGRYALRVMVDLAEHQGEGYLPLKEIAQRQEISEKYLESILKVLVAHKLLAGLRGKGGGYRLTRTPEEYTVGSILRLTEGSLAPVACLERNYHRRSVGSGTAGGQRSDLKEQHFSEGCAFFRAFFGNLLAFAALGRYNEG